MEKEQAELEEGLKKQKEQLNELGGLEAQLRAREERRKRFADQENTAKDDRAKAANQIAEMRD